MLRGRNGGREKQENEEETPNRAREATRLSFRFAELSNCLWQVEEKKKKKRKKGRVTREPAHPSFFPLPSADDVCRSTTLENRRLFFARSFPWIHRLGCLTSSLTLSHLIVCENLEIYSVSFPPFFFFSSLYDSREMTFVLQFCTFISLSDIISYKISYVKFLIQIFNSFTTRYATEMRSSIQATNKRRIVVLSKGLSKE